MADQPTPAEAAEKLKKLLEGFYTCMMVTEDPTVGGLRSRPMAPQPDPFDGSVYFFIDKSSHKVNELRADHDVCLAYADPGKGTFVSLTGTGRITTERAAMEAHYHKDVEAWFPKGLDDPCIALLTVDVKSGEYWEGGSSVVTQVLAFAKAKLTGERLDPGENAKVDL